MRKIFLLVTALLILTSLISFTSAEIIVKQQPKEVYNLGDSVNVPITVKTISGVSKVFEMTLICQDIQRQFFKDGVSLNPGEEKTFTPTLLLTKEEIGNTLGTCKIKGQLGEDYILTNEFEISNLINIQADTDNLEFNPGEYFIIKGNAQKANGADASGFLNIEILSGLNDSNDIRQLETIGNGFFSVNISLPSNMRAGSYLVKLDAYEVENDGSDTKTNSGFTNYNVNIKQVPTSLEINFESSEINPGESLNVRGILRDQTGENIPTGEAIITIKKQDNQIIEQVTIPVGEFHEYNIPYNEAPEEWTIVGVSNKLTSEGKVLIKEKKSLEVVILNETINLVNTGNIPYEDMVLIKIGEETLEINASLGIDEVKKYKLTAPEGEYQVEVVSGGEQKLQTSVALTGRAIDVKQVKAAKSVMRRPLAWIFMIMILGFVAFMVWKKGLKKSFFGKIKLKKKSKKKNTAWEKREELVRKPESLIDTKHKALLSLSMKGEKHPASVVCLKIKNLSEIQKTQNNVKQTLNKIGAIAEEKKATIYENQENIFFIVSPTKTKTFKNQEAALDIAELIVKEITNHNKLFKQHIHFGISLSYGNIVAKISQEDKAMHFMSLGNLIAQSKKFSTVSNGKILVSEEMKDKLKDHASFQEHKHPGMTFYTIKEKKNPIEHAKFLSGFMKRMEKEQPKK
jgi:hypothetical protein